MGLVFEERGAYFGVPKLGEKVGGQPGGAEAVLTWGQCSSCGRDGCGSCSCHLESDRVCVCGGGGGVVYSRLR